MNVKPKEIFVNLPIALTFKDDHEIPTFAATINTIIHGKVKVKCETVGSINGQYVGLFYLQRNHEYQAIRESFLNLIESEEIKSPTCPHPNPMTLEQIGDNDLFYYLETVGKTDE